MATNYEKYRKNVNFIKKYSKAINAATGSEVDANANVESKNIATCQGEMNKKEIIGTNRLLMHDKIEELYGAELADEYIRQLESHEIYKHDETSIAPYCVSITMYPFLFNGLKSLGCGTSAPKHLQSFCGSFINLVYAVSSQFAGAVATPEFLTYLDYFIRKEFGDDYYLRLDDIAVNSKIPQTIDDMIVSYFNQIVYSINTPASARNFQAVFWNIAYFDKPYFEGIFEDFVFPDGTAPQWESVSWLQKRFMKWFNKERLKNVLTFPVETMNLLNDGTDAVDKEYADFASEMYAEGHSFFTYTSDSVDSLASCCFDASQECIYVDDNYEIVSTTFKKLYDSGIRTINAICHGKCAKATVIRLPKKDMVRILTVRGDEIKATVDHLFPTEIGDIAARDLNIKDELIAEYPDGSSITVKIALIEAYNTQDDYVYCFQMEDQTNPYFMLANGIVVHNCRLRNAITENVFSYTLGAGGISTGSKGVITININRLVQNAVKIGRDISEAVTEQVDKVHKYLTAYNEIIKGYYRDNMLPVYNAGFISLEKQYLTVGINGCVEGAEFLGIDISPNDDYLAYCEKILKPIFESNKAARTKELMFNTEFVPAENLGVKNAKWDKEDGYFVPRDCYNSYFYKVEDNTVNVIDKFIMHGNKLTKYLDGGSAYHCNLSEHLSKAQYRELLKVAIKEGCNYYTYNVPNTVCNKCGHISKHYVDHCLACGSNDVDYASRVIGYLKLISKYSQARQEEANRRSYQKIEYGRS